MRIAAKFPNENRGLFEEHLICYRTFWVYRCVQGERCAGRRVGQGANYFPLPKGSALNINPLVPCRVKNPSFQQRYSQRMAASIISARAIERRSYWIREIVRISGAFGTDTSRVEAELAAEISKDGTQAILDHLRLCGSIPEGYRHDSSEEKLYSKYTDALLAESYRYIGLTAAVYAERADAADVEAVAESYSLIADAKVFRMSRTQKIRRTSKSKLCMVGNAANLTRWLFVPSINCPHVRVKYINKPLLGTYASSPMRTYRC
jgi:hypothetical protein